MAGVPGKGRKRFNTKFELVRREEVLNMCWSYLRDNFHKFAESSKIRIITALCTKSIPQEHQGISQQIIIKNEIIKNGQPHRYNIGTPEPQEDTRSPREAITDNAAS